MTHPGAVPAATVEQAAGVAQRCRPECGSASQVRASFSHQKQSRQSRRTDRLARIRVRPAFAPHNSLLRVEYTRQRWPIDEGIRDLHQSQTQTHTLCVCAVVHAGLAHRLVHCATSASCGTGCAIIRVAAAITMLAGRQLLLRAKASDLGARGWRDCRRTATQSTRACVAQLQIRCE